MAVAAALPFLLGGAAVGFGISKLIASTTSKFSQQNNLQPLPQAPKPEDSQNKAMEIARKKRAAMSQSVYTNPLGTSGQAQVAQKSLLGQ